MKNKALKFLLIAIFNISFSQMDIVGGEDCDISEFPWQASISISSENGWYYSCGASVINEYWILTAAHCVEEGSQVASAEDVTITVGSTFSSGSGGDDYEAEEVISHSSYGNNGNDIALVRTKEKIQFSDYVQPIALMCSNQVASGAQDVDIVATITGWGNTSQGGEGSSILQYIEVPIVDYDDPNLFWGLNVNENTEIIAGLVEGGMDSCQGDSGGPMAVRNSEDTEWLLAGITSWGLGCAQSGRPGVYTKVSNYINWINANTDGCINGNLSTACNSSNGIPGCTDSSACNYNPAAEINTCCVFSSDPMYDCDGDCYNNSDNDVICDEIDNCPDNTNTSQSDSDDDGVGNACDNCTSVYNPDQNDTDGDGEGDACDMNDGLSMFDFRNQDKLLMSFDLLGRSIHEGDKRQVLFYLHEDGKVTKVYQF